MAELVQEIWQELGRASADRRHPWRYPCLATTSKRGPSQRTMVLRSFDPNQNQLFFYTDYRSDKVAHIEDDSRVSILFYHSRKQWQLRIEAVAHIYHKDELAFSFLLKIPEEQRRDYTSNLAPGSLLNEGGEPLPVQENFTVLVLKIRAMDFLKLGREQHQRFYIDADSNEISALQP